MSTDYRKKNIVFLYCFFFTNQNSSRDIKVGHNILFTLLTLFSQDALFKHAKDLQINEAKSPLHRQFGTPLNIFIVVFFFLFFFPGIYTS